jgi:hypothetical protein
MLPVLSGALTVARAIRGLMIEEVAEMTFLSPQDVFNVENNLEDAEFLMCVLFRHFWMSIWGPCVIKFSETGTGWGFGRVSERNRPRSSHYATPWFFIGITYAVAFYECRLDNQQRLQHGPLLVPIGQPFRRLLSRFPKVLLHVLIQHADC